MNTQCQPQQRTPRVAFGLFEVDVTARELRKSGVCLRLAPQPFEILLLLLEHPCEVVTRDQLRERIWRDGTFVDFERGLNSAMAKLRRALNDSAEIPRYIETVPGLGYRFIGTLTQARPANACSVGSDDFAPRRPVWLPWWIVSAAAAPIAVAFLLGWGLHRPERALPPGNLIRMTADPGLSGTPVLSADGKLVAYSSDRSLSGERDLYVKEISGGRTIRLTSDGAGNMMPDFSPDGNKIVFRSNRSGGGIFEISAFGGEARRLAGAGWDPKLSPDGSQVAYWVGAASVAEAVPGSGAVWLVPVRGGKPRRVGAGLTTVRYPIWCRDGKRLLVVGYKSANAFESSSIDWWLLPVDTGEPVRTGVYEALARSGLEMRSSARSTPVPGVPSPGCWSSPGGTVVFSMPSGSISDLWEIGLSERNGKVTSAPRRLTTSPGEEVEPSCGSGGSLAFTHLERRLNIWLAPFDANRGVIHGALTPAALDPARRDNPSLSADGQYAALTSDQSGQGNIWIRDLVSGNELSVAPSKFIERFPVSNRAGKRIAYSVYENDKRVVYISSPGGTPEKLCEGCLRATDWSRDEKTLLVFGGNPYQINVLEVASHRQTPLLKHPAYHLLYGRFSPDNRWVSFTARTDASRGRIAIAPIDGPKPVPEDAWITIAEAAADDYANWSPDGKTIYFTSGIDGYSCLWGQRIEASSHRPAGEAFAIQHLHGRLSFGHAGWSVAAGRIGLALVEDTGNIWLLSRSGSLVH